MIRWPTAVFVATAPTCLRASFDALAGLVRGTLGREPRADALYVFHNRRRTLVKILWHDGSGYCVFSKRLDRGAYRIPLAIPAGATHVAASQRELAVLLEGFDPALLCRARRAATSSAATAASL